MIEKRKNQATYFEDLSAFSKSLTEYEIFPLEWKYFLQRGSTE